MPKTLSEQSCAQGVGAYCIFCEFLLCYELHFSFQQSFLLIIATFPFPEIE